MHRALKGTLSATFLGVGEDFKSLVVVSLVPALLLLVLSMTITLITIRQYTSQLAVNPEALSIGMLAWLGGIILPSVSTYLHALWYAVISNQLSRQGRPALLPTGGDLKNAFFVLLYSLAFLVLPFVLMILLVQFGFYLAGKPQLSGGTVTIPWQESAPLLAAMAVVFPLMAWLTAVCCANLPRIARGYRPNLFRDVASYSRGVQTALTFRAIALLFAMVLLMILFAFALLQPMTALVASLPGPIEPNDTAAMVRLQIRMEWINLYFAPILVLVLGLLLWLFARFWHEVDERIKPG